MSSEHLVIALDAMGGDDAPKIVVEGASIARIRHPELRFLLFGDKAEIEPLLEEHPELKDVCELRHTPDKVSGDAKPSIALRSGRNSSMRLSINAVKDGDAACVVSAGNTGALMAMAKFVLKTLPGVNRPAICSFLPTMRGECVMLDLGANVECDAENLIQFSVMGSVFARTVLGLKHATLGLLNIGEEEVKGHKEVRAAGMFLKQNVPPNSDFVGYVEGDGICTGQVDVVVTDGFTGNVALKTVEGTARLYTSFLKNIYSSSLLAKISYILAKGAFAKLKMRTDPRRYNGAMFLGLQGVCVKSHGGTDGEGFANAIAVARDLVAHDCNDLIIQELDQVMGQLAEWDDGIKWKGLAPPEVPEESGAQ